MKFPVPAGDSVSKIAGFKRVQLYNHSFLLYQLPITLDNQLIGLIQLAAYTGAEDKLMGRMSTVLLFGSIVTILAASSLGYFLARKSMAPIGKVIEAANEHGIAMVFSGQRYFRH